MLGTGTKDLQLCTKYAFLCFTAGVSSTNIMISSPTHNIYIQQWHASAKWHPWRAPRCGRAEVRLLKCTVSEAICPKLNQHGDVMNTAEKTVNIIRARGLSGFLICCRCWTRGPALPGWCALANARIRAAGAGFIPWGQISTHVLKRRSDLFKSWGTHCGWETTLYSWSH